MVADESPEGSAPVHLPQGLVQPRDHVGMAFVDAVVEGPPVERREAHMARSPRRSAQSAPAKAGSRAEMIRPRSSMVRTLFMSLGSGGGDLRRPGDAPRDEVVA